MSLRVSGLSKAFPGGVKALDSVDFQVESGEVCGLLGVNGAGKTTLMRILATLIQPDAGEAWVDGINVQERPLEVRRRIGLQSGNTALYAGLPVREFLRYFGRLYSISGRELDQRLEMLRYDWGLHDFWDRPCGNLSTGQTQRVSLARALIHNPPVLLFDEPTNGLDVVHAQVVYEFIERVRGEGRTILYSTHVMSEAERLCSRIILVDNGRVIWTGSTQEAIHISENSRLESFFLEQIGYRAGGGR
ncbi:MAG: ATP-binding cassette domain-containing protein [Fimbriimonadaceae bacterium]|nr:ATP-binding cassette domain-containing protein [Fimbriimonadaceae bacterium]